MTNEPGVVAIATQATMALVLVMIGLWGRSSAKDLPSVHLAPDERVHRAAVMHRGATACIVIGVILTLSVVWVLAAR